MGGHGAGTGWGRERGHRGGTRCFYVCVCVTSVFGWGWGILNSSLGPLAKTPVGLSWQPHEAAWQEESCI